MSVTFIGTKSVGQACLALGLALPALAPALADVASRVAGLTATISANAARLAAPPSPTELATSIALAAASSASAVAALSVALPASLLSANASLAASVATLTSLATLLQGVSDTFTAAASAGGVHVLGVDSTGGTVGPELAAALAGPVPSTARVQGVVLLTESPSTFSALSTVVLTT